MLHDNFLVRLVYPERNESDTRGYVYFSLFKGICIMGTLVIGTTSLWVPKWRVLTSPRWIVFDIGTKKGRFLALTTYEATCIHFYNESLSDIIMYFILDFLYVSILGSQCNTISHAGLWHFLTEMTTSQPRSQIDMYVLVLLHNTESNTKVQS